MGCGGGGGVDVGDEFVWLPALLCAAGVTAMAEYFTTHDLPEHTTVLPAGHAAGGRQAACLALCNGHMQCTTTAIGPVLMLPCFLRAAGDPSGECWTADIHKHTTGEW